MGWLKRLIPAAGSEPLPTAPIAAIEDVEWRLSRGNMLQQDRPGAAAAGGPVDRPAYCGWQGDQHDLRSFAADAKDTVAVLLAEGFDVCPGELRLIQSAHRTTWTFGGKRSFAARPPAPPPLIGRLRADPQPVRDLHRAEILLMHLHGTQPHVLTPGPPSSGQASTIWVSHDPGVDPPPSAITQARRN
jgi:hypothetical protein